ncbi:DUF2188 domain-containing protein [Rossellomorea vietnamensis]|uniref:DUF2188 domain-containing protein n=1 Tax=Rossellomorea vietnamensis TaxID=218284 RepID=A0A5D4NKH3_9BACI|nr:DUF2188 domain-containing protein [Rossellomorea vietnamensis]TYS13422.1 DUF2188 domain-containing protein [Rossellomorea vietnamensis]
MPWSKSDYPASWKNLSADVRNKAIEIGNALLREGYEDGRAIAIATDRAEKYVDGDSEDKPKFHVQSNGDGWELKKDGSGKSIYTEDTKEDLLEKAKPYVNDHDGILVVHKSDGDVSDTLYDN